MVNLLGHIDHLDAAFISTLQSFLIVFNLENDFYAFADVINDVSNNKGDIVTYAGHLIVYNYTW